MDLLIFNNIERDTCIKAVAEKDNITVLREIIDFSETCGVTNNAVREYTASLLADDDNILFPCLRGKAHRRRFIPSRSYGRRTDL